MNKYPKLLIASGDRLNTEITFTAANKSFVFILLNNRVYYFDSTVGTLWYTDKTKMNGLSEGHKKMIKRSLKTIQ